MRSVVPVVFLLALPCGCAPSRYTGEVHEVNLDDPVRYHLRYIESAIRAGKRAEVRREYEWRAQLSPDDPIAHVLLGYTLEDDNTAFKEFDKAADLDPKSYWALVALGEVYGRMDIQQRAEDVLRRAIYVRPRYPQAHAALGEVHRKRGEREQAVEAFEEAIRLDPENLVAHKGLGNLFLAEGDEARALQELTLATLLSPDDFELHLEVARLLDAAGNRAEAHAHFRAATELKPTAPQPWYGRARTARAAGLVDDAVPSLEKVLELKPYHHLARRDLADLLREQGDFARAATLYRDAVRATPGDITAHRGLGLAYEGLGKHFEALRAFDDALHVEGGDSVAKGGIARVEKRLGLPSEPVKGASIQQVFDRALERIAGCYVLVARSRPELAGRLIADVEIDAAGEAVDVEVREDGLDSPEVDACLRWTVLQAVFPPGNPVTAEFTVDLPLPSP